MKNTDKYSKEEGAMFILCGPIQGVQKFSRYKIWGIFKKIFASQKKLERISAKYIMGKMLIQIKRFLGHTIGNTSRGLQKSILYPNQPTKPAKTQQNVLNLAQIMQMPSNLSWKSVKKLIKTLEIGIALC